VIVSKNFVDNAALFHYLALMLQGRDGAKMFQRRIGMSMAAVSNMARVSTATVSRVINNHPHVAPHTAQRVRQAMEQLKYQPRPYGTRRQAQISQRRQASRKIAVWALVLPEVQPSTYPTLIDSFADEAYTTNHQVMTCCSRNDVGKQADIILRLMDHQVAGVALVPATVGPPPVHHVRQLQSHGIPVVFVNRCIPDISAPLIALDFEQIGQMAAMRLIEAGHRRVAYFCTHRTRDPDYTLNGFKASLERAGYELPDEMIFYGSSPKPIIGDNETEVEAPLRRRLAHATERCAQHDNEAEVEAPLRRLLAMPAASRPTAIFCSFDPFAEAVYMVLHKFDVAVPREMSVISAGGKRRIGAIAQRLSAVTVDAAWAGRTAVRLLDEICRGRRSIDDPYQTHIPLHWYPGQTLQCSEIEPCGMKE